MDVSNVVRWAQIIAPVVAFAALLTTVVISFATARSGNQRGLRERLRQQLRQMDLVCHIHFKREGWEAIADPPKFSFQALDQIHQDGLLSPNLARIELVKGALREIREIQMTPLEDMVDIFSEMFGQPRPTTVAALDRAFTNLDSLARTYLRALGKMDNAGPGGYLTYLRYRFGPVDRPVSSTE